MIMNAEFMEMKKELVKAFAHICLDRLMKMAVLLEWTGENWT